LSCRTLDGSLNFMSLRERIIELIESCGWQDYVFKQGDHVDPSCLCSYKDWLNSLNDNQLLDAYRRVVIFEYNYDCLS